MDPRGYFVILLVLVTAGISYYYGRKITLEWLDDKIRRQVFEEAKKEYREVFEKRFENICEGMTSNVIEIQNQEIEHLSAEVKRLKEQLKEKRK